MQTDSHTTLRAAQGPTCGGIIYFLPHSTLNTHMLYTQTAPHQRPGLLPVPTTQGALLPQGLCTCYFLRETTLSHRFQPTSALLTLLTHTALLRAASPGSLWVLSSLPPHLPLLLLEMKTGVATVENTMVFPEKVKHRTTMWCSGSTSRYLTNRIESRDSDGSSHTHVHSSNSHSSQRWEQPSPQQQMSDTHTGLCAQWNPTHPEGIKPRRAHSGANLRYGRQPDTQGKPVRSAAGGPRTRQTQRQAWARGCGPGRGARGATTDGVSVWDDGKSWK